MLAEVNSERVVLNVIACVSAADPREALQLLEATRLEPEDFSHRAHADVFRAATDFLRRGVPLELFALETALGASGAVRSAGGRAFLAPLLMEPQGTPGAVHEHARVLRDRGTRRSAIDALRRVAERLKDTSTSLSEALAIGAEAWQALVNRAPNLATSEGDVFRLREVLDAAAAGRRELCIPTGIAPLDAEVGGLVAGQLSLVGALPGVGKSALLATIVRNIADRGVRVGFFSLEDERLWVAQRLTAYESSVPLFVLCTKPLTPTQVARVEQVEERVYRTLQHVVIDDRQRLTPVEVCQTGRDMVLNHGCKLLVVDHLGELELEATERHDLEVAKALSMLRELAKQHRVPVLVASHVRRRPGLTPADEPSLTDFANSSAPERMARLALGLSRPESTRLRVTVLKQTNGPPGGQVDLDMIAAAAMVDNGLPPPPAPQTAELFPEGAP